MFGIEDEDEEGTSGTGAQPAYKKFKAEFESNLIGGTFSQMPEEEDLEEPASVKGPSTRDSVRRTTSGQSQSLGMDLDEPSQASGTQARAGKRKVAALSDVEEDDSSMRDSQYPSGSGSGFGTKRRAIENVNSVTPAPSKRRTTPQASGLAHVEPLMANTHNVEKPSRTISDAPKEERGAAITGVDTAPEFLQALASKKRGKKKEDIFDREFNNLRITVPKNAPIVAVGKDAALEILERERARAEEMEAWDSMGKDMDIRGNFMVVIESDDILRKDGGRREAAPIQDNGVPNFKKFKKVRGLMIALVKAPFNTSRFTESPSKSFRSRRALC